jgi:prohibitin 1
VEKLPALYRELGFNYDDRVLKSVAEEVIKSIVADYDAEQLITMRDVVAERVSANMREKAALYNIEFQDVSLIDIQFGAEFRQSVEYKQVAAQEAEMQKFLVEAAEHEKEAKVIRAEGEAQAAEMLNNAIVDVGQGIIELRKIEAAKDIAAIMSRSRNVAYLPGGGKGGGGQPMFLNLNVGGQ